MSESTPLTLMFGMNLVTGFVLGLFFYIGLWWTTRRVIIDAWSPLWFIGSFVLRVAVVISGFYLLAMPDWKNMLICLVGFLLARFMVTLTLQRTPTDAKQLAQTRDSEHAP